MSVKLMAKAWEMPIPTGQKMVLLALCDHANDDGACYPSQDKIAQKCSMSLRAIVRHIKWLDQPPSGGCELKRFPCAGFCAPRPQPPSGGCELKHSCIINTKVLNTPAAFGRL